MRILEVTDCYPPPVVGGRDLQVQLLSHELASRGHEVNVVALAGSSGPRTEMDGSIPVHRVAGWSRVLTRLYVDPDKPFHPTLADPGVVRVLRRLLRELRPDVVHAHSWMLYSFLPLLPWEGTKVVVSIHEYGFVCPKNTFSYRGGVCSGPAYLKCVSCAAGQYGFVRSLALTTGLTLMRPWTGRVDRYIANSAATARASARLPGPGGAPIAIIPPFVPDSAFGKLPRGRPGFVPPEGDYLMFAGGLGPYKGLDVLLEAWGGLDPKVPLVVAGVRRPDTPKVFPPGVIVAEDVPHREVLRAWNHCVAAIVPSRWPEPFGTVALEAMAAGVPVVVSKVGGLRDLVVDEVTGILVPPGDSVALRRAMGRLLSDQALRQRLGGAGRERALAYSASTVVRAWEEVFRGVVLGVKAPSESSSLNVDDGEQAE